MKTLKITALLAALSVASGIAMAQPAETTATERMGARGDRPGMMDRQQEGAGPHAKLAIASRLESLTEEQKTKVEALIQEGRAEMQSLRQEMRTAMEQARAATDREARRKIMEPIRQKHEAIQQRVDTALQGILTPEQMQEINQRAEKLREKMGDRMREGRRGDDATTGARKGKAGKPDGEGKNRRGERRRGDKARPAADDAATTASDAPNPFADQ